MNPFTNFKSDREEPREALPVSRLLRRMRNVLEIEIGEIWVEGEVSNLRKQGSGHWYFSLKDEGGQIACAMFTARRRKGHEVLEDGAKVRAFGEVTLYEIRGTAQLVIKEIEAAGLGDLQARFEALKQKLDGEGLFAPMGKKELPYFPMRVGIVTSGSSAALQDMLNVLSRRAPWVTVYLADVPVQGQGAERGIARAIQQFGRERQCQVVIVGRGGGSIEDLWNFNEEVVARAIAECPIPVVSAVGHEIDFTISDFVADLRAPTPSAAAELVVPEKDELKARVQGLGNRITRRVEQDLTRREEALNYLQRTPFSSPSEDLLRAYLLRFDEVANGLESSLMQGFKDRLFRARELAARWRSNRPEAVMTRQEDKVFALRARQNMALEGALSEKVAYLERLQGLMRALGPESAFDRGFTITLDEDGRALKDPRDLKKGALLKTVMKDGAIVSRVEE